MADQVEVAEIPDDRRFVIRVDGTVAGFAEYVRRGDRLILTHTEIDPEFEGQGLGSRLARGALDAARAAGDAVVPLCPFMAGYIEKHDDYEDLVDRDCLEYLDRRRAPNAS